MTSLYKQCSYFIVEQARCEYLTHYYSWYSKLVDYTKSLTLAEIVLGN